MQADDSHPCLDTDGGASKDECLLDRDVEVLSPSPDNGGVSCTDEKTSEHPAEQDGFSSDTPAELCEDSRTKDAATIMEAEVAESSARLQHPEQSQMPEVAESCGLESDGTTIEDNLESEGKFIC